MLSANALPRGVLTIRILEDRPACRRRRPRRHQRTRTALVQPLGKHVARSILGGVQRQPPDRRARVALRQPLVRARYLQRDPQRRRFIQTARQLEPVQAICGGTTHGRRSSRWQRGCDPGDARRTLIATRPKIKSSPPRRPVPQTRSATSPSRTSPLSTTGSLFSSSCVPPSGVSCLCHLRRWGDTQNQKESDVQNENRQRGVLQQSLSRCQGAQQ